MKKIIFLAILGILASSAPLASADTSVQYPATFILKLNESTTISNYLNMKITLQKISSDSVTNYISNTGVIKSVDISVATAGGCGPNADPRCLGMPAFEENYTLNQGGSVNALALKITVTSIGNDGATFVISIPDTDTPPPNPAPTPIAIPGKVEEADTGTKITQPPASFNLPKGQELIFTEKVEATGDASVYYKVTTKKKARLFFIFPVYPEITYSVNSETGVSTVISRPWWNFLAW